MVKSEHIGATAVAGVGRLTAAVFLAGVALLCAARFRCHPLTLGLVALAGGATRPADGQLKGLLAPFLTDREEQQLPFPLV